MIKILLYGPETLDVDACGNNGRKILGSAIVTQIDSNNCDQFAEHLVSSRADVILGWGPHVPLYLKKSGHDTIKRWFHFDHKPSINELKEAASATYHEGVLTKHRYKDDHVFVSICTPAFNSGDRIVETYESLKKQTYKNYEWIIVDDGSTDDTTIPLIEDIASKDHKVKPHFLKRNGRIGFMKRAACSLGTGDVLVELDHDDFLVEHCIEKVVKAFKEDDEIGMVYSNCTEWIQPRNQHGQYIPWNQSTNDKWNCYGAPYWEYRDTEWNGKTVKEGLQWDAMGFAILEGRAISPVIMHMPICPNHVRAFRSTTYHNIGCHRDLVYADDYDLMLRMFVYSKIHHIPEMLYVQRMRNNTWTRFNDYLVPMFHRLAQFYQPKVHQKLYELGMIDSNGQVIPPEQIIRPCGDIETLVLDEDGNFKGYKRENAKDFEASPDLKFIKAPKEDKKEPNVEPSPKNNQDSSIATASLNPGSDGKIKVDLGCGDFKPRDFIGVDYLDLPSVDVVHDLSEFPWPFEDNSIDHLRAFHVFEHLIDKKQVMHEACRILKPGGILEMEVPTTDGHAAWSDPDHVSYWNADVLKYFCPELDPVVFHYAKRDGIITTFQLLDLKHAQMRENVIVMRAVLQKT